MWYRLLGPDPVPSLSEGTEGGSSLDFISAISANPLHDLWESEKDDVAWPDGLLYFPAKMTSALNLLAHKSSIWFWKLGDVAPGFRDSYSLDTRVLVSL